MFQTTPEKLGFELTQFIVNIIALIVSTYSIYNQRENLTSADFKRRDIAKTSQNFFTNLAVMFIVLIYKVCMCIVFFFVDALSYHWLSIANIFISPIMIISVGVHILGTIE